MAIFAFLLYFFFSPPVGPETTIIQCGTNPDGVRQCVEIYVPDGSDCDIFMNEGVPSYDTGGTDNGSCN